MWIEKQSQFSAHWSVFFAKEDWVDKDILIELILDGKKKEEKADESAFESRFLTKQLLTVRVLNSKAGFLFYVLLLLSTEIHLKSFLTVHSVWKSLISLILKHSERNELIYIFAYSSMIFHLF